ncbi:uncharacterized protein [Macrobrachium rosenbergii]|uniref:uncharacterized protein n=1 Tax=Macrobrachium rosenbergii TaxID=79674 RepID=UPI0034D5AE6A
MRVVVLISLAALVASEQKRSAEPFKFDFQIGPLGFIPFGIGNQKFGLGIDIGPGGGKYGVYGDYGAKYGANFLYPQQLYQGIAKAFFPKGVYSPHLIGKRSADPEPGIGYGLGGHRGFGGLGFVGRRRPGYGGYGGGIGKHGGLVNSRHYIGKRSAAIDIFPEYHIGN